MVTPVGRKRVIVAAIGLMVSAGVTGAAAQSRPGLYVGGSLGSFSVSADEVDDRSAAGGIFGGVALSRYVDAEVELVLPTDTFTRSYTGISTSFAPQGSSRAEIERLGVMTRFDKYRDVSTNFSAVVIIHPPAEQRFTPGFIIGVTNQHVRERTTYTPLSIPPGVDPRHPYVNPSEEVGTRNLGALTIGGNLSIALTRHLFVIPDVRYDYGSIGDEINNALRTSVKVAWRF